MKHEALARAFAPLAFVCAASACSSASSSGAPVPGGGADATTDGNPGDPNDAGAGDTGPTSSIICGAAPYVTLGIVVRQIATGSGPGTPVAGAGVSASLCPGTVATSAADGTVTAQITKGAPFFARLEAMNYATTLIAEMQFDADKSGIDAPLPPSLFTALVPSFGPTKTAIVVGVTADVKDAGACGAVDGITFAVDGHPEARITYYTNDAIPQATTGTTTTAAGRAAITGLTAGAPVSLTATKPGCIVEFARAPYTGRVPLEAGALSLVPGFLR